MRKPIWEPSEQYSKSSALYSFQQHVELHNNRSFLNYSALHDWSIQQIDKFWEAVLMYFDVSYSGTYNTVLDWDNKAFDFVDASWFSGISLSYSEHIFKNKFDTDIALRYADEEVEYHEITWKELRDKVSIMQQYLQDRGIQKGDRVAAVLNNTIDSTAIFLAVNSLGAVWSCCSPDFGDASILERFQQITPKILFVETAYQYNGKKFIKTDTLDFLKANIPSVSTVVQVDNELWRSFLSGYQAHDLDFERVEFDFPIWILYSSGTTGKPKAITHRTGGNLLEHYKALALHQNVLPGENYLWYTTTGWMMWNYALSSLLCGATLCIFNGAIQYKEHTAFWSFVRRSKVHHLGAGAAYFSAIHDVEISDYYPKVIGSTGSPLPIATFDNLQHKFPNVHIISLSGGTDVCSAFLSGCAYLPVYAGEIQCRTLGSDIVAVNDQWKEVINEVGELVIKQPMPSMPLKFWNDPENTKYRASYFEQQNGLWSHGDWIKINDHGGIQMFGRSDATLNRGGVRIGTAEIYNVVNALDSVVDSLVISLEDQQGNSTMIIFLQLVPNTLLEDASLQIKQGLRTAYSPRHVPDTFYQVDDIPYTLSGKKLEIPVKKIFSGTSIENAVSKDIMRNPECLIAYAALANTK